MKILLKNARILKMDDTPILEGNIVINNNIIEYIGLDVDSYGPFDIVRDCHKNLLMPGFKNAHAHSAMTFLRSKSDDHNLHDWLFDVVFPKEKFLTAEYVYHMAKVSFLEYLSSGITACFDQYYFPESTGKAAEEMGMRVVLLGTYNSIYSSVEKLIEVYKKFNDNKDSLVKYCLGIHAEYTLDEGELDKVKEAVYKLHAPFYTHISETASGVEGCIDRHGVTPVQYLIDNGLYDYGGGGYHCIYFNDEDIANWKKHNLIVVTCPGSNSKLASGIAPIARYLKEGITVAIGTDGPASNNCLDMFKEMMLVTNLQKLVNKDPTSVSAYEVLKMATVNGAKAMNLLDADILEVNKKADIIEIDLSQPNMQPINDIVNNLVYSGSKSNIKMTMINGNILYDSGKYFVGEDIEDIYKKCQEVTDEIDRLAKN